MQDTKMEYQQVITQAIMQAATEVAVAGLQAMKKAAGLIDISGTVPTANVSLKSKWCSLETSNSQFQNGGEEHIYDKEV